MKKKIDTLGVMIDMSRNSVMSIGGLKRFLPLLKKMGYNCVMLYTEDTYEVDGEPYFGYMRGRYSKDEMKEIDAFAASLGIEMIPCMQTLAHLNANIRWGKLPVDCNDILLVDDERTYQLIDHMFATLSECFASRRIHIGMDEAHMLGRGAFLDRHGYEKSSSIIERHLKKVCEIAKKYDYQPLMWSDMFFRSWNHGCYYTGKCDIPKDVASSVPDSVIPVYWDYYHNTEEQYSDMIYNHRQLSKELWFAGGVWSWTGFIPHNAESISEMIPAIRACRKNGVSNILMTLWGDNGGECSHFSQLPALCYIAEYAKGNEDEASIKAKFRRITGVDYDDFIKIDIPNVTGNDKGHKNPSKYMLYSDYFNDFLDYTVKEGVGAIYAEHAADLRDVAKKTRKYGYLFNTAARLCEVLEYKYELGIKTRNAYTSGDKDTLRALADRDYPEVEKRLKTFRDAFENQWFYDNKTCGFDVQDLRIGGLIQRTASCRKRIKAYLSGKIDRIEELDEALLPFMGGKQGDTIQFNNYNRSASTNVF